LDRGTRVFWALIIALLGASGFFATKVEQRRRVIQPVAPLPPLATGDLVRVTRVVEGNVVVVTTDAGVSAALEIAGIKTFDATLRFDDAARFGALALDELRRLFENESVRVELATPARDKRGRVRAHLYVGETDVGLALVKKGLALTYSVYPFPTMSLYAEEQAQAQAERQGFWADPRIAKRAELLERQWRREKR
jgi:endonuclease YncB( thermonuclease family)